MENKKTKIAIVIVVILIVALIALSYFYSQDNNKQIDLFTVEINKILESDLSQVDINQDIKTEENYAEIEKAIKEYISNLKNIYAEMEQLVLGINPNSIFSAENMPNKSMEEIDQIIEGYKEKSQTLISEYEELIKEDKIKEHITNFNITNRNEYYINLYNEIMLSETMQTKYLELDEDIKNEKGALYEKLNKIEKIKEFLEENDDSWTITNNKIQFRNLNRMTEYYNLLNQIID